MEYLPPALGFGVGLMEFDRQRHPCSSCSNAKFMFPFSMHTVLER
jgi:hypothetical protein